MALAENIVIE